MGRMLISASSYLEDPGVLNGNEEVKENETEKEKGQLHPFNREPGRAIS